MRFDTRQNMQLSQQMKLAPRMIQSMEILQLPMLALQERIEQELESNVALEQVEPGADNDGGPEVERDNRLEERELVVDGEGDGADDFSRLDSLEKTYSEAFDNQYSSATYSPTRMDGERDRKMDALANVAARSASLTDQLTEQWRLADVSAPIRQAGERIIAYIDDDGLLSTDLQTILDQSSESDRDALSIDLLDQALEELQWRLDPPGIGARSRQESLLIQIDRLDRDMRVEGDWDTVRTLIESHYDDLLRNRLPKIAQATEFELADIQEAIHLVKKLNLSPARDLVDVGAPPVTPDVIIEYDEETDEYIARLADGSLPALRVSPEYEQMARDKSVEKSTRDFVGNNVRNASWLIDSINLRKATLLRVVRVVLSRQRAYFDHGAQHLKPLPMIEVADQLGIHVGTVSRAVSEKWLQTPRGLVQLRKFFSGGAETDDGEAKSWEAIRATLKEIIDNEDKSKPLSDEALSKALKDKGIDIARRTVVKYRSQLGIPSARMRKQHG